MFRSRKFFAQKKENEKVYIIVGLGNPGKDYKNTRHNIGFDVIDVIADKENISVMEKKHKALIGKGVIAGQKVILAKHRICYLGKLHRR